MGLRSSLVGLVPFLAMVMVECLDVGLTTLSKAAMSKGMSHYVFVVYSNALATLILLPSSFIIHRNKRPPLTISLLCKFFLLSLAGITVMQNCVFTGVSYSSPTLASAMSNLVPAFTFLLAVIFSSFGSVVTFSVLTWCIHKKGPLFVAMFKPLGIAIAALMGVIFLGDTLHVGSVIGAIVIVAGFYAVIWTQYKEEERGKSLEVDRLPAPSQKSPLLERQTDA